MNSFRPTELKNDDSSLTKRVRTRRCFNVVTRLLTSNWTGLRNHYTLHIEFCLEKITVYKC